MKNRPNVVSYAVVNYFPVLTSDLLKSTNNIDTVISTIFGPILICLVDSLLLFGIVPIWPPDVSLTILRGRFSRLQYLDI
jgi:hypothetical protein